MKILELVLPLVVIVGVFVYGFVMKTDFAVVLGAITALWALFRKSPLTPPPEE